MTAPRILPGRPWPAQPRLPSQLTPPILSLQSCPALAHFLIRQHFPNAMVVVFSTAVVLLRLCRSGTLLNGTEPTCWKACPNPIVAVLVVILLLVELAER